MDAVVSAILELSASGQFAALAHRLVVTANTSHADADAAALLSSSAVAACACDEWQRACEALDAARHTIGLAALLCVNASVVCVMASKSLSL